MLAIDPRQPPDDPLGRLLVVGGGIVVCVLLWACLAWAVGRGDEVAVARARAEALLALAERPGPGAPEIPTYAAGRARAEAEGRPLFVWVAAAPDAAIVAAFPDAVHCRAASWYGQPGPRLIVPAAGGAAWCWPRGPGSPPLSAGLIAAATRQAPAAWVARR